MKIFATRVTSLLKREKTRQMATIGFFALVISLAALQAQAINAPTAGSFMYDAYDIVVNSLLKGALGFVVAMFVFVTGIAMFFRQMIVPGVICVVCTALIIKSDLIIASLGMVI